MKRHPAQNEVSWSVCHWFTLIKCETEGNIEQYTKVSQSTNLAFILPLFSAFFHNDKLFPFPLSSSCTAYFWCYSFRSISLLFRFHHHITITQPTSYGLFWYCMLYTASFQHHNKQAWSDGGNIGDVSILHFTQPCKMNSSLAWTTSW